MAAGWFRGDWQFGTGTKCLRFFSSEFSSRGGRDSTHDHFIRSLAPGATNAITVAVGNTKVVRANGDAILMHEHCVGGCICRTVDDIARSTLVGECPRSLHVPIVRLEFHLNIHTSIRAGSRRWRGQCRWSSGGRWLCWSQCT